MPAYYENFAFFTRRFNLFKWPAAAPQGHRDTWRFVSLHVQSIYVTFYYVKLTYADIDFFYTSWCLRRQIFLSIEKTRGQDSAGRHINFVITSLEDWLFRSFVITIILTRQVALIAECCPGPGKDSGCNVAPSLPHPGWIDTPGRSRPSAEITRTSCARNSRLFLISDYSSSIMPDYPFSSRI